jgi:hypothetical protein
MLNIIAYLTMMFDILHCIMTGKFSLNGKPPPVHKNVQLIKGLFNETLVPFLESNPNKKIGFINIDMDLYSGCYYVLQQLLPRFQKGSILHFHELFHRPSKSGGEEMRALHAIMRNVAKYDFILELISVSSFSEQAVFRVHSVPS